MMTKVRKPIAVLIAAIMILLLLPVSPALLPQAQASANVTVTSFDFSSSPPTSGRGTVSNVTANGFTFSANLGVNDAYTDEFGMMQVTPDTTYALHVDINDPTDTEIIVFYMENNSGDHWTNHIKAMDSTWNSGDLVFTVPQGIHYVRFRVDVNTMGNTRTFSNFRLTKFPSPHNMFPDISSWNLTGSGRLTQNKKVAEGFQCTAPYTDSYTGDTPLVAVAPGGHYWLTCDIDNPNDTELIAFFHRTSTSGWYSLTSTSNNKSLYIEVPSDVNYLTFRVDVNTQGNTRTFYNFRLYDDYWRYINLDNDFSLLQWQYEKGLNPGNACEIRYRDPNYFTTYATGNDSYTDYSQAVPVSPNTTYTVACDNNGGSDTEMVVFYYRSDGSSCDPWVGGAYGSSLTFTAPSDCAYIRIRVDRNTAGNTTTFSNFRMYRADDYICCEPNYYLSYRSAWSSLPSPTRPGYSFGGWYTERGGNGYLITTVNPTSPYISLYAKWTKLNYTATLDADGGSVSPTSIGYAIDSTATLTTPSKEGYDFLGWKPTADSGNWSASQTYAAGTSLNGKYGDVTLKAQWQIKSYGVTFSADGTGYTNTTPASTVTHGGSVSFTVTLSEGYTNSGNPSVTATNGSVSSSKEGNTITYTVSNITGATAINVGAATLNTYTVKFVNSLTGEQIGPDQTVAHGSAATAPAVDEYVQNDAAGHWKFTGWDKAFNSVTGDLTVNTVYETEAHSGGTAKCNEYAKCDLCGAEYGDYADHEYGEWIQQINKTCLDDGILGHYTCSVCGKYFDADHNELVSLTIAHEGHKPVKTERKASTCTEKGNIEYYTCDDCGKIFTEEACEHEITAEQTVLDYDYTNHSTDERVTKNAKDAKCNEDGYTGDIYCAACDHEVTHGSVIPKESIAHTPVKTDSKASTCTEKGNIEYYTCSVCGKIFMEETCENEIAEEDTILDFDYTNHSTDERVTKNAKDAKCNEDGYTGDIYCAACDHEVTHGSVIPKESIAHTPVKTEEKAATCTEKGNIEYYTCSVCGKIFTEETCENEIAADDTVLDFDYTNHSTDERVTKNAKTAKCNEDGYTGDIYCAACDHEVTHGSVIAKESIAHTPVKTDSKASTCTEKGNIEYYTCSVCGKIFTEETCENEIAAEDTILDYDYTNHSTTETVTKGAKDATCSEDGYTGDIYCAACDHLIEAGEAIPSGGTEHVFGEWYVKTAPTCTEEGVEERDCENCGESETRPIEATGHSFGEWFDDEENGPTCGKDGVQHRVCAKCSETETREVTASEKGHSIRLPNDEGEGYCAFCGEYRCLFCEKDEHMHETNDASVMTFFIHIVHIFYHMFSNFRYTLSHR